MVIESEQLIKSTLVENKRRHYINLSELGICMHLVQFVGVESVAGVTVLEGGAVGERAHQARPPVLSHLLYQLEIS
jgi:hypothetical protein